jgi:hypothetical protein
MVRMLWDARGEIEDRRGRQGRNSELRSILGIDQGQGKRRERLFHNQPAARRSPARTSPRLVPRSLGNRKQAPLCPRREPKRRPLQGARRRKGARKLAKSRAHPYPARRNAWARGPPKLPRRPQSRHRHRHGKSSLNDPAWRRKGLVKVANQC